jgi:error-prone DNA polymerase
MSASMIAMRGRLQKEGEVIHVIVDRVIPRDDMLRSVGRMDMPVTFGRGDGATMPAVLIAARPDGGRGRATSTRRLSRTAPIPRI